MRRAYVTFARIGDLVMFLPMLCQLARGAELRLVSRPWAADLLAEQPFVAAVHGLDRPHRGTSWLGERLFGGERRRLLEQLASVPVDEIVVSPRESLAMRRFVDAWAAASGARRRDLHLPLAGAGHVVDRIPAALTTAGFNLDGYEPEPRLEVTTSMRSAGCDLLARSGATGRVIAVQAGSSLTDRRWRPRPNLKGLAPAQWGALIGRLLSAGEANAIVLLGSGLEQGEAAKVRAACAPADRARVLDLTGAVDLRRLPGVFAACRAAISVDTGPGHVAAAVGCPVLSLFGPTDPTNTRPRGGGAIEVLLGKAPCQFCHNGPLWKTCRSNLCLTSLSEETLWAAWKRLVARLPADSGR